MDKLNCPGCTAPLTLNNTDPFLVCAYCGTSIPNPHYEESKAAAAEPTLDERCVQVLVEMGEGEEIASLDKTFFGSPLENVQSLRRALEIPDSEKVYLVLDHVSIIGSLQEAVVLADSGLYYRSGGERGRRSWEAFITGPISAIDREGWQNDGQLLIGSSVKVELNSDKECRLARFLIDFHNRMYLHHTGSAAPAAWCMRPFGQAQQETPAAMQQQEAPGLGDALRTAARVLLTGSVVRRVATPAAAPQRRRPPVLKPAVRPEMPPRPLRQQSGHTSRPLQHRLTELDRPRTAPRRNGPAQPAPIRPTELDLPGRPGRQSSRPPMGRGRGRRI